MLEINTNITYIHKLTLAMTVTKESDKQGNYICELVPAVGVLSALRMTPVESQSLYPPYYPNTFLLLARSPDDPQRIRVASVFELFSVCLSVSKFSNFSSPHPPLL